MEIAAMPEETTVEPGSMLDSWLNAVADQEASDLHVGAFRRPMMRVSGSLEPIEELDLTPEITEATKCSVIPSSAKTRVAFTDSLPWS